MKKTLFPFLDEKVIPTPAYYHLSKAYYSASNAMIERVRGQLRGSLTCGKIVNNVTLNCIMVSLLGLKTAESVNHMNDRIRSSLSEHLPIAARRPVFSDHVNPSLWKSSQVFVRPKRFRGLSYNSPKRIEKTNKIDWDDKEDVISVDHLKPAFIE